MTADRVDGVIAALERHDPELASRIRLAADALTAGEGEEVVSQAGLQEYLWYQLPGKSPEASWRPVAEAVGVLLSVLGLDRYAAIARSPTTAAILAAWGESPAKGFARFRAARAASGVEPPDTERLAWGTVMGREELTALGSVELALEAAIVAGDLRPGLGPWRRVAAEICVRVLDTPAGVGGDRKG